MTAIYISNDNDIVVEGLCLASDGSFVNDAAIKVTLKDSDNTNVTGAVDLNVTYVSASNGNYRGTIPASVTLTESAEYTAIVTASNYGFSVDVPVTAERRRQ